MIVTGKHSCTFGEKEQQRDASVTGWGNDYASLQRAAKIEQLKLSNALKEEKRKW